MARSCRAGRRLAVISDEGGPLVSPGRAVLDGKEPDAEVWLVSHNGLHGEIRVDRIGRPPDRVKNPALTVCLAIQPVVLSRLYRIPQLRDRGLLGRFLFAMPPTTSGTAGSAPRRSRRRWPPATDADDSVVTALAGWTDPMVLRLDPARAGEVAVFRAGTSCGCSPTATSAT